QLGTGLRYDRAARNKVEIFLDEKTLMQPLHWRKPRMIFVCSMTDLFGVFHSNEMINRVFAVMALASQHTFQVLTKRPEGMREYLKEYAAGGLHLWRAAQSIEMPRGRHKPGTTWPLPHVWVGASIEDEPTARKRFADLVEAPAAVRFISYEPALGPVPFKEMLFSYAVANPGACQCGHTHGFDRCPNYGSVAMACWECGCRTFERRTGSGIHLVIAGGESGPHARPSHPDWFRQARDDCKVTGTKFFFKQAGVVLGKEWGCRDEKGGDPAQWPREFRIRELPRNGHGDF